MSNSFGGVGALTKLAIGPTGGTISRMDFLEFTPQIVKTLADGSTKAIRGTLDHQQTSVAEGLLHVRFRTKMYVTSTIMDILWPQLGVTLTSYTGTLADSLPDTDVILGCPGVKEQLFTKCIPTDWVMYGAHGTDPIIIDIGWEGRAWSEQANGTFFVSQTNPALVEGYTYPFAAGSASGNASMLTFPLGTYTGPVGFPQFRLHMDYKVVAEYNNSITPTNLMPTDHVLRFATSVLYNPIDSGSSTPSTETFFDTPMSGDVTGAQLILNFQRAAPFASPGNYQTTLTVANMKAIARPPRISQHDYVRLPINLEGYASGGSPLLTVVNKTNHA
jgi:hypothetical protein